MAAFKLQDCLVLLIKPLARLCLRHAVPLQDVIVSLKAAFYSVAVEELDRSNVPPNASRISAMTGLHRKELRSLEGLDFEKPQENAKRRHVISRIIAHWRSQRGFSVGGKPRVLSYDSPDAEFFKLVRSISSDLNPYTVLNELERAGLLERTPRGVRLKASEYLITKDVRAGFEIMGGDVEDLMAGVGENLFNKPATPNLHLRTEYNNIPADRAEEVRDWLLTQGSKFHQQVRAFLAKKDRDENPKISKIGPTMRVAVGTFSFTGEIANEQ